MLSISGGNHTLAVTREGLVYGWGRNDFGQSGLPADKTPATPRKYFYQAKVIKIVNSYFIDQMEIHLIKMKKNENCSLSFGLETSFFLLALSY